MKYAQIVTKYRIIYSLILAWGAALILAAAVIPVTKDSAVIIETFVNFKNGVENESKSV